MRVRFCNYLSRKAFVWILAALACVRLVLMWGTPVFEPSEARYAAISANMARSGDFVIPRFTHNLSYQSFDGKPPLVFQAGGLFCEVFGVTEFAVRLFPFLSAVLLLAILFHAVRRLADEERARLAVVVCATSVAFYAAAGISMTDLPLTASVAGALLLYRLFLERFQLRYAAGVAALLGAGMIVKGPVSLVLFGLPVLADAIVNRRWKGLFNVRWLAVAPIYLAVAVPWFVLVEARNPGSVWYFFYNENFLRFVSHDYGDKYGAGREAFRGAAVLWAFVVTLPWALLVPWRRPKMRDFFFLSVLAIVGFWCLTSRVLVYYLFPMVPLFAAYLAIEAPVERLWKAVIPCAALAALATAFTLVVGALFSEKMRGAATPFDRHENHYAYEFYHGRLPESELERQRALWQEDARGYEAWLKAQKKEAPVK